MLRRLQKNGQRNIRLGLVKLNLKRLRIPNKMRKFIEMNNM